jgi:hypothetical protein
VIRVEKLKFPFTIWKIPLFGAEKSFSEAVIPAKAGIQFRNTGFRVKPGMTNKYFLDNTN